MISIIGGIKKRTKIQVASKDVRPTSALKRRSIFSIIDSYGAKINLNIYKKANILDLFAGSGALGLEAISRGAAFGYFYENSFNVIVYLKKNCLKICQEGNFEIIEENILESNIKNINKKISIVFIDPPYKIYPFEKILRNMIQKNILSKKAIIIIECSQKTEVVIPHYFYCFNKRIYGKTKIYFLINNSK